MLIVTSTESYRARFRKVERRREISQPISSVSCSFRMCRKARPLRMYFYLSACQVKLTHNFSFGRGARNRAYSSGRDPVNFDVRPQ